MCWYECNIYYFMVFIRYSICLGWIKCYHCLWSLTRTSFSSPKLNYYWSIQNPWIEIKKSRSKMCKTWNELDQHIWTHYIYTISNNIYCFQRKSWLELANLYGYSYPRWLLRTNQAKKRKKKRENLLFLSFCLMINVEGIFLYHVTWWMRYIVSAFEDSYKVGWIQSEQSNAWKIMLTLVGYF